MYRFYEAVGVRAAVQKYCKDTPIAFRSFEDFCRRGYNQLNITKKQFNDNKWYYRNIYGNYPDNHTNENIAVNTENTTDNNSDNINDSITQADSNLEDNNFKIIDGYRVGLTNNFNVTPQLMYEWYNSFNERYFSNELPSMMRSQFKISNASTFLGQTSVKYRLSFDDIINYQIEKISLSTYVGRNEKTYMSTMLHEMIHVYEVSVLKKRPGHQYNFIHKMNEINSHGEWNVSTQETEEEQNTRGSYSPDVLRRTKNKALLVIKVSPTRLGELCIPKDRVDIVSRALKNIYGIYDIIDPEPFMEIAKSSLRGSRYSYTAITEDKILEYIRNNQIRSHFINGSSFNESQMRDNQDIIDAIEGSDPNIEVQGIRKLSDTDFLIDMTII